MWLTFIISPTILLFQHNNTDITIFASYRYSVSTQTNQDGRRGYHGNPRGRRKSWAKDRRLQKGMSWLEESEEDLFADEEFQWKQYLDVIRPRYNLTLQVLSFLRISPNVRSIYCCFAK